MSYTVQPLPDLWQRLAQSEAFAAFSLVQDTARGLPHASFAVAFAAAVEQAAEDGRIWSPTRRLLLAFGEGCGRTDLEGQQAHIAYYRALLTAQEEEARRTYEEKGRMYRVLGIAGGAALMLLLM